MTTATMTSVVVVALGAALAPLVADLLRRWLPVPSIVLEIGFGVLVGPAALGLARAEPVVEALANFGLVLLFFLAGYEINLARIPGGTLRRALGSWVVSLALGLAVGALAATLLGRGVATATVVGLALATTALGVLLPMIRDAGVLDTRFGAGVTAVGAVGEFAPIVAVALLLGGYRPVHATVLLLAFGAVAVAAAAVAMRRPPDRVSRVLTGTLSTSGQFGVRLCVLAVLALVWVATELHLDLVLGAFAGGVVVRLALAGIARHEAEVVESKLEGLGFGMLIPFFFVTTGLRFDLPALASEPGALALLPAGLAALLLVRGVPAAWAFRRALPRRDVQALGLYAATSLPLVVVVTTSGVANGHLSSATAAGMVGAAMLSVLVLPMAAGRLRLSSREPASGPPE